MKSETINELAAAFLSRPTGISWRQAKKHSEAFLEEVQGFVRIAGRR